MKFIISLAILLTFYVNVLYAQLENYDQFRKSFYQSAWETASYDLNDKIGYDILGYMNVPRGAYNSWDVEVDTSNKSINPHSKFTVDQLYVARTGGVYRGEWYSPDEIGQIYRQNGIFYGGMGNSNVESVWIRKKYGLHPVQGIPGHVKSLEFTGFSERDYDKYRDSLKILMLQYKDRLINEEKAFDISIIENPNTLWVLTGSGIIQLFLDKLEKNYDNINKSFKQEKGFDIPLIVDPSTPQERARSSIFLQWVRGKMQSIMALQMKMFRQHINPEGTVISNIHGEDVIDYGTHGEIVDHPGPSGRAQFSNKELVLKYWNGYIFRLWRDLTDKPLFASARINNGVIRARSIPTSSAVKYWHSQAIQNGTVGFYQWLKDYGPRDIQGNPIETPLSFDGPAFANPDSSTLGQERWNTVLDISRNLSHSKVFDPPSSKTGILISFDTVNIHGWKRVFSMYTELVKSGVWNSFISDREIMDGSESLDQWDVVYIPVMDYSHPEVIESLREFVENGGVIISMDPKIFSYDMEGNDISHFREEFFGVQLDVERSGQQSVKLDSEYTSKLIYSQEGSYNLIHKDESEVIGTYSDGSPAVVYNNLGEGGAIYWGSPLANIYLTSPYYDSDLDGRRNFYKSIENESGIEDYSWIWDVTVDNVEMVTGEEKPELPPIQSDIPLD